MSLPQNGCLMEREEVEAIQDVCWCVRFPYADKTKELESTG